LVVPNWINYCKRVFGDQIEPPTPGFVNEYFGGENILAPRTVFLNAVEDPWKYAGLLSLNSEQKKVQWQHLIDCDNCAHCIDLKAPSPNDPAALTESRELIYAQLREWLSEDVQFLQN